MLVFMYGERIRTNDKLDPLMTPGPGFQPLVAGEHSSHCANPASQTFGLWNYSWPGSVCEQNYASINLSQIGVESCKEVYDVYK